MARSSKPRRGTFGAFRRPFLTDPVFWIAAGMSVVAGIVIGIGLFALTGAQTSFIGLAVPLVGAVLALCLTFKLLAMGMNTSRALEETQVVDEPRAQALEDKGRAAGAVVGKGAAALVNRRKRPNPAPAPTASPPSTPTPPPAAPSTPTANPAADGEPDAGVRTGHRRQGRPCPRIDGRAPPGRASQGLRVVDLGIAGRRPRSPAPRPASGWPRRGPWPPRACGS